MRPRVGRRLRHGVAPDALRIAKKRAASPREYRKQSQHRDGAPPRSPEDLRFDRLRVVRSSRPAVEQREATDDRHEQHGRQGEVESPVSSNLLRERHETRGWGEGAEEPAARECQPSPPLRTRPRIQHGRAQSGEQEEARQRNPEWERMTTVIEGQPRRPHHEPEVVDNGIALADEVRVPGHPQVEPDGGRTRVIGQQRHQHSQGSPQSAVEPATTAELRRHHVPPAGGAKGPVVEQHHQRRADHHFLGPHPEETRPDAGEIPGVARTRRCGIPGTERAVQGGEVPHRHQHIGPGHDVVDRCRAQRMQ